MSIHENIYIFKFNYNINTRNKVIVVVVEVRKLHFTHAENVWNAVCKDALYQLLPYLTWQFQTLRTDLLNMPAVMCPSREALKLFTDSEFTTVDGGSKFQVVADLLVKNPPPLPMFSL